MPDTATQQKETCSVYDAETNLTYLFFLTETGMTIICEHTHPIDSGLTEEVWKLAIPHTISLPFIRDNARRVGAESLTQWFGEVDNHQIAVGDRRNGEVQFIPLTVLKKATQILMVN